MPSATTDRRRGLTADKGVKAPVDLATTANIVLSGEQTIDGVLTASSRVLVKNQTVTSQNGFYDSSSAAWTRCIDSNGNGDLVKGQLVGVTGGTQAGTYWHITSANPITIDTSAIVFAQDLTNTAAALTAALANTADPAQGDALVGFKRTQIALVASTLHLWHEAQVINVKSDGGCAMDGATDDTAALQAVADALNTFQNAQVTAQKLTKAVVFFPDGNMKLTDRVKWHGFVALIGTATGYTGGSTIRQTVDHKNIFEFYGSANDHTSLATAVEGLNFEFNTTSTDGIALYYPKFDDVVPANVLVSNSHYIRRNRFGGWYRNGTFLKMLNCNDVEVSSNIVDVCPVPAMVFGDSGDAVSKVTDLRIFGNNFFDCFVGVQLLNVQGVAIDGGNVFSQQFANDWTAIQMTANGNAIVADRINSVTIGGNEFSGIFTCYRLDGSASDITIAPSTYSKCKDYPVVTTGATDVQRLQILGGTWGVDTTYTRVAVISSAGCKIKNSTIRDMLINANGVNALNSIALEQSGPVSPFGAGMTISNNRIFGNTIASPNSNYQLVPCSAGELVIEDVQALAAYPTSAPVFNLSTLSIQDSFNCTIDYEVEVNKSGGNIGTRVGRVQVSVLKIRNGGNPIYDVTSVSSVADDFNGTGGTSLPTVTFSGTTAAPQTIAITVSAAGIAAPVVVNIRCRAHSFRATGTPQIKSA